MAGSAALHTLEADLGASFMNFGPPPEEGGTSIAAAFGSYEPEYAAVRQRVGLMHLPQRCVLRVTGADRAEFLHRMLTCNVQALRPGSTRRGFQLDGKGRVVADLMLHHGEQDTWLETDTLDVEALRGLLEARLFAEDVALEPLGAQRVKLALHGPAATALLEAVADEPAAVARVGAMAGTHHVLHVAGTALTAYRYDDTGALGLHLLVPGESAAQVYRRLLEAAGYDPDAEATPDADYAAQRRESLRGRPIGWLAYNTARIEAGTPIFHVDFGHDSLPAETGVIDEAVDFDKGCYIGQEIVARMRDRGHPRRVLVGIRFTGGNLPVAGAQVLRADEAAGSSAAARSRDAAEPGSEIVGGITSSTLSPLLGQTAIAFAVVKWDAHQPGTRVRAPAEESMTEGHVHALRFISGT